MQNTCQSEYKKLKYVFIKTVKDAFISEEKLKNEWAAHNYLSKPDLTRAIEEYEEFKKLLFKKIPHISCFPESEFVTIDSIYCRDASIATDHGMIICNMGKHARALEPKVQKEFFDASNIPVLGTIKAPGTLEGGDVAWLNKNTLAVGHTYRTNLSGIKQLKELLAPYNIEVLVAELPHYKGPSDVFHLMSILSPVDKDLAVVYSLLMPIAFRNELLDRGFSLVEVPEHEFESMGCNVLAVAPRECIMVAGNPHTENALRKAGCTVDTYAGQEISYKGGGGPTCLTRPIYRMD
ncbi:dimethylarginine dimethylaminohydrolase family protein [Lentiprolixibacter aurantiacus]|uniref:arginine deiminase n=1 Tax=Lentiprolixibacter aurantiacus TaxID=2993939 RepID=A0AAE3SMQ4_9FLAO|nr:arginine deiminase family protein [Lentiprolixibacter aurantiacus]MCX2718932.1 arginine deiminase family protein [Lentiprolixibacter aurantiacus]